MPTINLLQPELSDVSLDVLRFPDGQPHLRIAPEALAAFDPAAPVRVVARLDSSEALLLLLLLKDVLDRHGFERVDLCISYLLAARMDRVMTPGEPFSLKVVARLLNSAGFRKIAVFDPHSDVATALLDGGAAVPNVSLVRDALADYFTRHPKAPFCLVSPDAGALKKVHAVAAALGVDDVVECMKERDVRTGKLLSFKTTAGRLDGSTCFIVDDICDGGGTFSGTAAVLRERGAAAVVLIVSHGIFSKGTAIGGIDAIYCTDSYRSVPEVTCFPVLPYLPV